MPESSSDGKNRFLEVLVMVGCLLYFVVMGLAMILYAFHPLLLVGAVVLYLVRSVAKGRRETPQHRYRGSDGFSGDVLYRPDGYPD